MLVTGIFCLLFINSVVDGQDPWLEVINNRGGQQQQQQQLPQESLAEQEARRQQQIRQEQANRRQDDFYDEDSPPLPAAAPPQPQQAPPQQPLRPLAPQPPVQRGPRPGGPPQQRGPPPPRGGPFQRPPPPLRPGGPNGRRPPPTPPPKGLLDNGVSIIKNVWGDVTCGATSLYTEDKLKDEAFIQQQFQCLLSRSDEQCDELGRLVKRMAPDILRGGCPPPCDPCKKKQIQKVMATLSRSHPKQFQTMVKKFVG